MAVGLAPRWVIAALVAAIAGVLLYPYHFAPANAVAWLEGGPGLSFAGEGIVHGQEGLAGAEPLRSISVELWLRGRPDSRNWGAREIFSLYDGHASPPLLLGAYGDRLFLFSRFEPAHPREWFRQLPPTLRLERGRTHHVAVTYAADARALFRDGVQVTRQENWGAAPAFTGRPILGNGPDGRRGWWGEVQGLAIFDSALPEPEIARHGAAVEEAGVLALRGEPGLVALYAFDEGRGAHTADALRPGGGLDIPARFRALPRSMLRWPGDDVPGRLPFWRDPLQNVLLFLPLGALLGGRAGRRIAIGFALSLGLETLQLWIPTRSASGLDVAWNTLGTAVGAALARLRTRGR